MTALLVHGAPPHPPRRVARRATGGATAKAAAALPGGPPARRGAHLHRITVAREEDGEEVTFTMPDFVEQGDELGEIALLVIRARQRWRELEGLGA